MIYYYPKNIYFLFTLCIIAAIIITSNNAINVQNMNDFQKSRLVEVREFPGENVLNGESKQQQPHTLDEEILGRIEGQLMGAMEMLQNYRASSSPTKYTTEKRKNNKFEFIRFGR